MNNKLKQVLKGLAFTLVVTGAVVSSVNTASAIRPEEGQDAGVTRQIVREGEEDESLLDEEENESLLDEEENESLLDEEEGVMLINEKHETKAVEEEAIEEDLELIGEAQEAGDKKSLLVPVSIAAVLGVVVGAILSKKSKKSAEDNVDTEK